MKRTRRAQLKTLEIPIESLVLKGGWKKDLDVENVEQLTKSMERSGQLAPISITRKKRVVWGYHRIAAAKRLGWKTIRVEVIDEEKPVEVAAIAENLHRRHLDGGDLARMRIAYLRLVEDDAQYNGSGSDILQEARRPGRPADPKVAARKLVAAEVGVKPDTLYRDEAKAVAVPAELVPEPPVLDLHGITPSSERDKAFRLLAEGLDAIEDSLKQAQSRITRLAGAIPPAMFARIDLMLIRHRIQVVATTIRNHRPESVCLYCKLVTEIMTDCPACKNTGYLERAQIEDVPKELLIEGDGAGVFVSGDFVKLSDLRSGIPAERKIGNAKQLSIVDEDGRPIESEAP
jgi:ParB-like chromosome segregation protein Spo0J